MKNNQLNILHVTFNMTLGGTQQVIRQLILSLNKDNINHRVLCIDGEVGELGDILKANNIQVDVMYRKPGFDIKLVWQLAQYAKKHKIDVMHAHQYSPYFYSVLTRFITHTRVIFTEHGRFYPDVVSKKRRVINKIFNLLTYSITAISKATAESLIKKEGFPREKVKVIYNGINAGNFLKQEEKEQRLITFRNQYQIKESDFVFGTISRIEPIKNQKMMINAFSKISERDNKAKLLIIGDGAIKHELEQLVNSLKLQSKVIFTGFIVEPQIYIHLMDVFLLPSFSEGTSMTLLEAMSHKKASVVTDVGGSPEIVLANQTGLVIENDNQAQLENAMHDLLKNKEKRIQFGENAFTRFNIHFTERVMAEGYEKVYFEQNQDLDQ